MLKSVWLEATVLNNIALDDQSSQITRRRCFFFTFIFLFLPNAKNRILSFFLVIYLWTKTSGDVTEGLSRFGSNPSCISTCTVCTNMSCLWMQTWILVPLLSSYVILSICDSQISLILVSPSTPQLKIKSYDTYKVLRILPGM